MDFATFLPESERSDLLTGYYRRLTDPDPAVHQPAANAWSRYETLCSNLIPRPDEHAAGPHDAAALALARIESHYFMHQAFLADDELIAQHQPRAAAAGDSRAGSLRHHLPDHHRRAPRPAMAGASYVVVPDAGHSAMEPGIRAALVRATETMKAKIR